MQTKQNGTNECMIHYIELEKMVSFIVIGIFFTHFTFILGTCFEKCHTYIFRIEFNCKKMFKTILGLYHILKMGRTHAFIQIIQYLWLSAL